MLLCTFLYKLSQPNILCEVLKGKYGRRVTSFKNAQAKVSDLRLWKVLVHENHSCWPIGDGSQMPAWIEFRLKICDLEVNLPNVLMDTKLGSLLMRMVNAIGIALEVRSSSEWLGGYAKGLGDCSVLVAEM
jgi:hypothetical protein